MSPFQENKAKYPDATHCGNKHGMVAGAMAITVAEMIAGGETGRGRTGHCAGHKLSNNKQQSWSDE